FAITPVAGEKYSLKLSQPAGIDKTFPLPDVAAKGAIITTEQDVFGADEPVKLMVIPSGNGDYTLSLSKHQTEIASTKIPAPPINNMTQPAQPITLTPPSWADGVLVATVKDGNGTPIAERLIFRKPAHSLHVKITPDKSSYVPGDSVSL